MKTSIILFNLLCASFLFSLNIQAQVSHLAERAESKSDKIPNDLRLDIIEIPEPEINNKSYIEKNINKSECRDSVKTTYNYERYDKYRNKYNSISSKSDEKRYICPFCNGSTFLREGNGNVFKCWRCSGKGYIVTEIK